MGVPQKVLWRNGFTLIEMILVSAIVGLLASIAIPKFSNLIVKAKEAKVKGLLGTLRSTISIYYADNEGLLPIHTREWGPASDLWQYDFLHCLSYGGKYIDSFNSSLDFCPTIPGKGGMSPWMTYTYPPDPFPAIPELRRGWSYNLGQGAVVINWRTPDSQGRVWSTY